VEWWGRRKVNWRVFGLKEELVVVMSDWGINLAKERRREEQERKKKEQREK